MSSAWKATRNCYNAYGTSLIKLGKIYVVPESYPIPRVINPFLSIKLLCEDGIVRFVVPANNGLEHIESSFGELQKLVI
jgi:hypothetical protein